jgi:beta-lactamase class A
VNYDAGNHELLVTQVTGAITSRMRAKFVVLPTFLAASTLCGQAHRTMARLDSLKQSIGTRAREVKGAVVAVAFHDLQTGDTLYLQADDSFHAASTMKVPVMIELFRQVDAGTLSLDQTVPLANEFASIVDGSPFTLNPADDSDSSAYLRVGSKVTVRELIDRMITRSSNLATNALIQLADPKKANETAHRLGATNIKVLRGVEDTKAFRAGLNNTTTARDLAVLLEAIETGRAASRAACDSMRAILLDQEFNDEIPAGVPPGVRVAHKTGWITGVLHDAALVYPPNAKPYVLVVLTRDIPDEKVARALIADISRMVYGHVTSSRSAR